MNRLTGNDSAVKARVAASDDTELGFPGVRGETGVRRKA